MTLPNGSSNPSMPEIVIAGASTRSAAFSALRAGFRPYCLDHFGDADLRAVTEVNVVADYPHGLIAAMEDRPTAPIMYVGAVENAGNVLDFMEMGRTLVGNSRDTVQRVRDPEHIAETFQRFGLPFLEVRSLHDVPERDGNWLVKPLLGAGGRGIEVWGPDTATPDEPHYYQQRAVGRSYSAVFVAPADQRDVRFVGVTRQVVGDVQLSARPFSWCGSIGPETLSVELEHMVRRMGNILSWKLGLQGLFGIDFIVDEAGKPQVTEINPRYTGSVEVLEHTLRLTLLRDHCEVFGIELSDEVAPSAGATVLGKFILYSNEHWRAPDPAEWLLPDEWVHAEMWRDVPRLADIPTAGTQIRPGQPVCSLFVSGSTVSECLEGLGERVASVTSRLGLSPVSVARGDAV